MKMLATTLGKDKVMIMSMNNSSLSGFYRIKDSSIIVKVLCNNDEYMIDYFQFIDIREVHNTLKSTRKHVVNLIEDGTLIKLSKLELIILDLS